MDIRKMIERSEILTWEGWKHGLEVTIDSTLGWLDISGQLVYRPPTGVTHRNYTGRAYGIRRRDVAIAAPVSRWLYASRLRPPYKTDSAYFQLYRPEDLDGRAYCLRQDALWDRCISRYSPETAALIGFAIGDGYIKPQHRLCLAFHLKRKRKIDWLQEMAKRTGWTLNISQDHYLLYPPQRLSRLFGKIYDPKTDEKQIPGPVFGWNRELAAEVIRGLIESDGSRNHSSGAAGFYTTSPHVIAQFQQLCLHAGAVSVHGKPRADSDKKCIRFGMHRRTRPVMRPHCRLQWTKVKNVPVYDISPASGLIYVRCNGTTSWQCAGLLEE